MIAVAELMFGLVIKDTRHISATRQDCREFFRLCLERAGVAIRNECRHERRRNIDERGRLGDDREVLPIIRPEVRPTDALEQEAVDRFRRLDNRPFQIIRAGEENRTEDRLFRDDLMHVS